MDHIRHDLNEVAQMYIGAEFHVSQGDLYEALDSIKRAKQISEKCELAINTELLLIDVDKIPLKSECKEANKIDDSLEKMKAICDFCGVDDVNA